jgi:hypothetical protein
MPLNVSVQNCEYSQVPLGAAAFKIMQGLIKLFLHLKWSDVEIWHATKEYEEI